MVGRTQPPESSTGIVARCSRRRINQDRYHMATASLSAEARTETGKGVARKLRAAGRVPAVIYGHAREAQALSLQTRELEKLLSRISTGSTVIELTLGGATAQTLIREIQRHPFKRQILHVDFQELVAGEKVTVDVPLVFVGMPEGVRLRARCSSRSCTASRCSSIRRTSRTTSTSTSPASAIGHSLHVSDSSLPRASRSSTTRTRRCAPSSRRAPTSRRRRPRRGSGGRAGAHPQGEGRRGGEVIRASLPHSRDGSAASGRSRRRITPTTDR